jgi:hypothetical protein
MKTTARLTMAVASSFVAHSAATLDPTAKAAINNATGGKVDVQVIMTFPPDP